MTAATATHSQATPHLYELKATSDAAKSPARPPSRKRWMALIVGAALSIVLPVLAFQGVNVSKSWTLILSCQGTSLALAGLFFLATIWFRSWRWQYLLAAQQRVRLRSCVSATCVGFLANNILPFRLGDLVRVGALRQLENASAAKVLGTVVVERILDILTLVFFLGLYLALATAGPHHAELMGAGLIALAGALFLSAVMVVGFWRRRWLQRLFSAPIRWINPSLGAKVSALVGHFLEGLQVFASPGQVVRTVLLSIGLWAAAVGSYYCVGQSLGLDLPLQDFVVVVFTTAFGAIIPAAPGGVGTFHSFAWMGLYLVAMHNGEMALAFAGLLHSMEWTLMNVTGLFFLWRDRLHLTAVAAQAAVPEDATDATPTPAGREIGPAPHPQPV